MVRATQTFSVRRLCSAQKPNLADVALGSSGLGFYMQVQVSLGVTPG